MNETEIQQNLARLIRTLQSESPEYARYAIPEDASGAFRLYRALANVRLPQRPHSLPDEYYALERATLRAITERKGTTDASEIPASKRDPRLALWQGDITTLQIDAIVNAANSQLLGCFSPLHGCIDNIIHTMGGTPLREKCLEIMQAQGHEEETGRAKITPGYALPAKYVLHTVGPIVRNRLTQEHERLLASCYTSCLDLAAAHSLKNIVFCCISTGVFRFPPQRAAEIAIEATQKWLDTHPGTSLEKIVFNVYKDSDREIYEKLLC